MIILEEESKLVLNIIKNKGYQAYFVGGFVRDSILNKKTYDIDIDKTIEKYLNNPITEAVVMQGLEPFDSWSDLLLFIKKFREKSQDDIIIYTGFNREEITDKINILKQFPNIIIKTGRFLPGHEKHYDEILGVCLASDNQRAERIS